MPRSDSVPKWKIAMILGTRPEVIKFAPLIAALKKTSRFRAFLFSSGQHRELLDQTLQVFGIRPDHDCCVMTHGQSLFDITHRAFPRLKELLSHLKPDFILVQGDTSTAFIATLAGFYEGVPVGHLEAGLRTFDMANPFPEEANRKLISVLASLHFAPTSNAKQNLIREGVSPRKVFITGNTVIDAVQGILRSDRLTPPPFFSALSPNRPLLLVTIHRRENFGAPLARICKALQKITQKEKCEIVLPVHENPEVKRAIYSALKQTSHVHLVKSLNYFDFIYLLKRSYLVLSDSGGVQEESAFLGKPVLVLREKTERPEVVEGGVGVLVGSDTSRIVKEVALLLNGKGLYRSRARALTVFGNGHAASKIVHGIQSFMVDRLGKSRRRSC